MFWWKIQGCKTCTEMFSLGVGRRKQEEIKHRKNTSTAKWRKDAEGQPKGEKGFDWKCLKNNTAREHGVPPQGKLYATVRNARDGRLVHGGGGGGDGRGRGGAEGGDGRGRGGGQMHPQLEQAKESVCTTHIPEEKSQVHPLWSFLRQKEKINK